MKDIKLSAIVVGRNESDKLKACLSSLFFCDEILYGDLSSTDNSAEVAENFGCIVFKYETYGPSCEYTQAKLIHHVSNDWVIMIDPDEVVDKQLAHEILELLPAINQSINIGEVAVPWQFYFGSKKLKGTTWGDNNTKGILINKNRFEILPITHYGRRLKHGFIRETITRKGDNVLHHYWMKNISSFISKHQKYLKDEGRDRYKLGERVTLRDVFIHPFSQFVSCYLSKKGYKDGFIGLFLSGFWAWYSTYANFDLYKIIKSNKEKTNIL